VRIAAAHPHLPGAKEGQRYTARHLHLRPPQRLLPPPRRPIDRPTSLIKSPMVGTFYTRPNPKAEAYVKVGSKVDTTSTVCIIEAMKVFNEIPAEVRGTIVAILVEDGEAVEFEKPLFKVDTSQ
jgi:acetyl-CoA carboxylase biotin carboxyl carrier protein